MSVKAATSQGRLLASVDVPVALLGYGTVGAAVHRLLEEQADEIERATGHRLRVVRALVRDIDKQRGFAPSAGVLTTDPAEITGDASIRVVAEVMGGVEPAGTLVLDALRSGARWSQRTSSSLRAEEPSSSLPRPSTEFSCASRRRSAPRSR